MHIVKNIEEFKKLIESPNPNQIYGLVPIDYEILDNRAQNILREHTDLVVYGDVEITDGINKIIKFNPSFDRSVIVRNFLLNSPIFVRTSRPIKLESQDLGHLTLEILHYLVGLHIPEPIYRWKQNFHIDPANATNIV